MLGIVREMEKVRRSVCVCRTRSFSNLLAVTPVVLRGLDTTSLACIPTRSAPLGSEYYLNETAGYWYLLSMFHQQGFMCYSFIWAAGRWPHNAVDRCSSVYWIEIFALVFSATHYSSKQGTEPWSTPYELPNQVDILRNYSCLIITL